MWGEERNVMGIEDRERGPMIRESVVEEKSLSLEGWL